MHRDIPRSAAGPSSAFSKVLTLLVVLSFFVTGEVQAAPSLTIETITFDVIGLDSNDVTDGPDTFPVGARICNTGDTTATNVVATLAWDSANSFITLQGSNTITFDSLPASECADAYFNAEVARTSSAYTTWRSYHIAATADGLGTVSTDAGRRLYVERLVSQNRNSVEAITGPGGIGDPAPTTVMVGQTYTYKLYGSTATQGYEQLEAFIDFPNTIFRVVSVDTTYTSPSGASNDTVWADACGFDFDPASPTYLECIGPENYSGGKAGGTLVSTYVVEILSAGSADVASLIYDFSGSSFHYNSDYGFGVNSITVTAVEPAADVSITNTDSADPVQAGDPFTYRLDIANAGPTDATGITVTDTLPTGVGFVSATGSGWSCTESSGVVTCARPTLTAGATSTITLAVTAPSIGGDITNTATVSTTSSDSNPANDTDSETTTVIGVADLSITKSDAADPVVEDGIISYVVTVSNAGPSEAVDVIVTDLLPPGVTFDSATPSQGSCSLSGSTLSCDLGNLPSGDSTTVNIAVTANSVGVLTNAATVASSTPDPDTTDNQTTEQTTVNASADLAITKGDAADPVVIGDDIRYRLEVTNSGPSDAADVVVTDTLPIGVTFVSATPSQGTCSESAGEITCSLGTIADGATAGISIVVTSTGAGTLSNTAEVSTSTDDPNAANDSATESTTVAESADLRITKTDSPDPVTIGNPLTYTITVDNVGPSSATSVEVVDALPSSLTFGSATPSQGVCVESSGVVTCALGSLASGASATITVLVTPTTAGVITNTATVTSDQPDPTPGNNAGETTTVSPVATTDLVVTNTDSVDPVGVGEAVDYTITVTNVSAVDATGVIVTDTLPPFLTFSSATPSQGSCVQSGGVVTCDVGTIAATDPDSVVTIVISAIAQPGGEGSTVTNTAEATSIEDDANPSDNTAGETTTIEGRADLAVTKVDTVDPVFVGSIVTYRIDVANLGPSDASTVVLADTLPVGMSFVSAATSQGSCSEVGGTVTCDLGTVAAGDVVGITISATASTAGSVLNTASVTSTTTDTDGANDSDAESTVIAEAVDLTITKTDSPDPADVGDQITYLIDVTNAGPSSATGVVVTDLLPPGVTVDAVTPSQGTCTTSGGVVTCSLGTIGASNSASVTALVTAGPSTAGVITNVATVTSDQSEIDPADNQAIALTAVSALADLSVTKSNATTEVVAGTDTTYTITIANLGPSSVSPGVVITDSIPSGATASTEDAGCALAATTVTCTTGTILSPGSSMSWDIVVNVPAGFAPSSITNEAVITSSPLPDPDPGNDTASDTDAVIRSSDLSMVKSGPASEPIGADITYDLIVRNAGPSDATGVVATDSLPTGVEFVSASPACGESGGTVTCSAAGLTVGSMAAFSITVRSLAGSEGTITNLANVSSAEPDPNTANNGDSLATTITPLADIALTITPSAATVLAGEEITYTIDVSNLGPSQGTGLTITYAIPAGATFSSASSGCSESAGVVTCSMPDLDPDGSTQLEVTIATAPGVATTLEATASVTGSVDDPDPSNNVDSTDVAVIVPADLSITMEGPTADLHPGDTAVFVITVRNDGPADAVDVVVADTIPAALEFVSADAGCTYSGGVLTCLVGDLPAGATRTIRLITRVSNEAVAAFLTGVATVSSPTPDVDSDDTTASVTNVVVIDQPLPFTGMDLVSMFLAGLATVGGGLLVLVRTRRPDESRA